MYAAWGAKYSSQASQVVNFFPIQLCMISMSSPPPGPYHINVELTGRPVEPWMLLPHELHVPARFAATPATELPALWLLHQSIAKYIEHMS